MPLTRMMFWQAAMGRPTRLVLLMDMMRSPILSSLQRSAGPPWRRLATTTVGRMEPQPDSTMARPKISPGALVMATCEVDTAIQTLQQEEAKWNRSSAYFSNVLGVGEVRQISVVQFLTFQVVAVLAGLQVRRLHAVFLQKLLVGHPESLTDGLGYDLSLKWRGGKKRERTIIHSGESARKFLLVTSKFICLFV